MVPCRVQGSKLQIAGWTTYSALIWTLKLSMLAFYIRLTVCMIRTFSRPLLTRGQAGVQGRYRLSIHVGFALVAASFVAAILAIYLSCRPFHKYWQIYPNPGGESTFLPPTFPAHCPSYLSAGSVQADRLGLVCREYLDRHLPDLDPYSPAVAITPEDV